MHILIGLAAAIWIAKQLANAYTERKYRKDAERMFAPGAGLTYGIPKKKWFST